MIKWRNLNSRTVLIEGGEYYTCIAIGENFLQVDIIGYLSNWYDQLYIDLYQAARETGCYEPLLDALLEGEVDEYVGRVAYLKKENYDKVKAMLSRIIEQSVV
jgi:hypothetical protein